MRRGRALATAVELALLTTVTAACTPTTDLTRAGIQPEPTRLTIGLADAGGRFTDEVAAELTRQAAAATDNQLILEFDRLEDEESGRAWNKDNVDRMLAGDIDLAIVPAQTWDLYGIPSFTALYVPQLVATDELVDAVALDPLANQMLDGLEPLDIDGLAVVPGGLRFVFGFGELLATPEDFAGSGIRAARSDAVWATFEALGARPDDPNGGEVDELIESGQIVAADSMFRIAASYEAPTTAGNLVLQPHVLTIVAGPAVLDALEPDHRNALIDAAKQTAQWATGNRRPTRDEAEQFCRDAPHARIDTLDGEQLARLEEALAPVAAQLTGDPAVAAHVERIREIDADLGSPTLEVPPCP